MKRKHHHGINYQKAVLMNKTVAIVGTHGNTREKAPYRDKNVDIWVFNNQILQEWCPRADAVFDIHPNEDIHRRCLEQPAFGEWVKNNKTVEYYTPYPLLDAPANKVYPLDEIANKYLKDFKRGNQINRYFTSGPCYALALAIHLGYTRIEFYGIEMESNAEYVYQRDGISLWFGIALGKGIEIYLDEKSLIFMAPLYGYDMDGTKVDREAFEVRGTELQQAMEQTERAVQHAKGMLDSVWSRIIKMKQENATEEVMVKLGQEYEDTQNAYEQAIANHAFVNGQYIDTRMWQARVDKALQYSGHAQELLAQDDEKWQRMDDRATVTGNIGGVPLPGIAK